MKSLLAPAHTIIAETRRFVRTRKGIRRLRQEVRTHPTPRIVVGSSDVAPAGWIPTEIDYLNLLNRSDWQRFFRPNSIAAILAEHVWEHLTPAEGAIAAQTCFDYLRSGGYLRLAVPDGFNRNPEYQEWVRPGGSGPGADDHKALYTCITLSQMLVAAGFRVQLLEYFDAAGEFHATSWDPAHGMIHRSQRFDERNAGGQLRYTSLIADAVKP